MKPEGDMKTIDLVYFNAGGGHRAAAQALQSMAREQQRDWCVRLVNLFDLLDRRQRFVRATGWQPEDYYNKRLAKGWTLGLAQELKILQAGIRMARPWMVNLLRAHWARSEPDLIVSLVPNFNRPMQQAAAEALPGVPYCTVLTDLADFPPRFWMERGDSSHIVCGSAAAVGQALRIGHAPQRIHRVSGMILRPNFYRAPLLDRDAWRRAVGLPVDASVGLVMFGGHGSAAMKTVARALPHVPLILLCGHNHDLVRSLEQLPSQAPRLVLDHTPQVAELMRMADFFIGKPGPGAVSEALHCGLPVITYRNASTLPQERFNAEWIRDEGLGLVVSSLSRDLEPAVRQLLLRRAEFKAQVSRLNNRAVFEVLDIFELLLRRSAAPALDRNLPRSMASAASLEAEALP
jgi:hypothetical protein